MPEDAETQLTPLEGELILTEMVFPDFRRDRMETAEGGGLAQARRDAFWKAVDEEVLAEAFGNLRGSAVPDEEEARSPEELDVINSIKCDIEAAALEEADSIGFWVAWHRAGGFAGLERAGWHRTTIFRRLRNFRMRFGEHPDGYRFDWISLDLERSWQLQIDNAVAQARGYCPD